MTQSDHPAHLPHLSQLDHLRPPPGWRTDCAVLSTYSAQTSVIVAALLALGGQDDDSGSGSKIGLARALSELRGKVHFVLQSGRLTLPGSPAQIVSLLDRFILQVPWDEGSGNLYLGRSWHAKFALVRHVPELAAELGERWVFLLGSRNLTMDLSWDIGLVLKTGSELTPGLKSAPQVIDGVGKIAADLADLFPMELKRWSLFAKPLAKVEWQVPVGLVVSEIRLLLPDTPKRGMPVPPMVPHRVLAVSPFLDGTAVAEVAGWGSNGVHRQILSTRMAFEKLAIQARNKLDQFAELLALPIPDHEIILSNSGADEEEHVAADQRGLHAKMLFIEHAQGSTLWMGSPNLTSRAWTRNTECYAEVNIQDSKSEAGKRLLEGIRAFSEMAETLKLDTLTNQLGEITPEQRLSEARIQVAARLTRAVQSRGHKNSLLIKCNLMPHPDSVDIALSCGPLIGEPVMWPRDTMRFEIAGAAVLMARSECLRIRLSLDKAIVEWLQVVPWDPRLDGDRDNAVLNDYLGPRQMSSWIHDVLNGYSDGDEGGPWDSSRQISPPAGKGATTIFGLPSIDQALRIWLKDKSKLDEVDRILQIWSQRRKTSTSASNGVDKNVEIHLQSFSRSWQALRKGLRRNLP
jgi:hypothetical protein